MFRPRLMNDGDRAGRESERKAASSHKTTAYQSCTFISENSNLAPDAKPFKRSPLVGLGSDELAAWVFYILHDGSLKVETDNVGAGQRHLYTRSGVDQEGDITVHIVLPVNREDNLRVQLVVHRPDML